MVLHPPSSALHPVPFDFYAPVHLERTIVVLPVILIIERFHRHQCVFLPRLLNIWTVLRQMPCLLANKTLPSLRRGTRGFLSELYKFLFPNCICDHIGRRLTTLAIYSWCLHAPSRCLQIRFIQRSGSWRPSHCVVRELVDHVSMSRLIKLHQEP